VKVIVQIPCYNEEATLPGVYVDIPRDIDGIDQVEVMVIDDGSTDRTVEVARTLGVDHIVINKRNCGLASSFRTGLDMCLKLGADIIVNTDGDNQYAGHDIPKLIQPILDGKADISIGERQMDQIEHFSKSKKFLQKVGSSLVSTLSGTEVHDAVSGFRAYSRDAALQMNIVSSFSYTIESVIQAGQKKLAIASVPVETNPKTRESRLFGSVPNFIAKQGSTIVRMYSMYRPLRVFSAIGLVLGLIGLIPIARFLFFYFAGNGSGHIQSLLLGATLTILGFITLLIALVADLIGFNRQLIETILEKVRQIELRGNDGN
jgi:glycosyltransferase involved in cell wall biosynthesis